MLMTRAPWSTDQRIAFASASIGIVRCGVTTFAMISCAEGNSPAIPTPSFTVAPISPATKVPCPCVSTVALPPTKLRAAMMCFASSGWPPSIPESMIAIFTGASVGGCAQVSYAWFAARYHWRGASGSDGAKAAAGAAKASTAATAAAMRRGIRSAPRPPES